MIFGMYIIAENLADALHKEENNYLGILQLNEWRNSGTTAYLSDADKNLSPKLRKRIV